MNLDKKKVGSVSQALKRAKRKQLVKTILISLVVFILALPVIYKTANYFARRQSDYLNETLFDQQVLSAPNIQIDSQTLGQSGMTSGTVITNRSKNINGYIVPWSTLTSRYTWLNSSINYNELVPGFYLGERDSYEYDKQTKQKVASFYSPYIKNYYDGVKNDLKSVTQLDNHVVEVAISFDKAYTYQEIQDLIPSSMKLNKVWYWLDIKPEDQPKEELGPAGMPKYGINIEEKYQTSKFIEEDFAEFFKVAKKISNKQEQSELKQLLKNNEGKSYKEVKMMGVMLTGRSENFEKLIDKEWVRGASAGVTVERLPYVQSFK
ncbi:anti sigma factor C-terminal domain-containing protein [Vagococcus intermedius]|uniref:Anti-sigma factor n=1 Tax=Vagococcus intermedius TaxID=2991418 RepID=A0AAF0CTW3_9ENTE|nr:anti sigma factor C-terminal domain-containing protein [Vagococcus intermedius]WEG72833.1 anti-sigma factor [Vagococcus intermedius]WEG74919.1 anti-sigma factor [Vagococcus intermedius]